jgi:uncharacterized membrane protein
MKIKLVGFTVFIVFFGMAMIDAIATQNWGRSIFWLAIGVAFLLADNLRKPVQKRNNR